MRQLLLLLLIYTFSAHGYELFEHEYSASMSGLSLDATRTLSQTEDGLYQLELNARHFIGSYNEVSQFYLNTEGYPVPVKHWRKSRVFGVGRYDETLFDWESSLATYIRGDDVRTIELEQGMVDRMLYQLLIAEDLRQNKSLVDYRFVDRGRVKHYTFGVESEELVQISDQEIPAIKIRRVMDQQEEGARIEADQHGRQTEIWLSPELNYTLARLVHVDDDGDSYEIRLKSY